MRPLLSAFCLVPLLVSAAAAEDMSGPDVILELGGGVEMAPEYEGSDDYMFSPIPIAKVHFLRLPGFGQVKGPPTDGLSIGPSFRYVSERDSDDNEDLAGLDDIDYAVELGASVEFRKDWFRGFVALRRGMGGHEGFVGEAGFDAIVPVSAKTEFRVGPRITFADSDYMGTYFGVSPGESVRSGKDAFDPEGGVKSVGLEVGARRALTENWALVGTLGYDRLVKDAADSPVTQSADQVKTTLGLSYKFGLDLFD